MHYQQIVNAGLACEIVRRQKTFPGWRQRTSAILLFILGCVAFLPAQTQSLGEVAKQRGIHKQNPRPASEASKTTGAQPPDMTWLQEAMKDPELMKELGQLIEKMQKGVVYPSARTESQILSHLPESTLFYMSVPNYGEAVHRAMEIFKQGLNDSPHLRAFLEKNKLDSMQQVLENVAEKFYLFSQYIGDEVVITGQMRGKKLSVFLLADVKKPGLARFFDGLDLQRLTGSDVHIYDLEEFAGNTANTAPTSKAPTLLVRPDFMIAGSDPAAVRDFNTQIDLHGRSFTSQALGQKLARSYREGTSTLIGVDLHQVIGLMPEHEAQTRLMLEKAGLTDVRYLVADSTLSGNAWKNQGEIVFNGPRRGVASWIAAPRPMHSLEFVPANTAMVSSVILKNPALIFDDLRQIFGESAMTSVTQMETQMRINLQHDLLGKLTGEIAFSSPGMFPMAPVASPTKTALAPEATPQPGPFAFILGVSDAEGLQQTLTQLLAGAPFQTAERQEAGVTFHTLTIPGGAGSAMEIDYFFLDGYLVIGSDPAIAEEALRAHRNGSSLANSAKLRDALGGQSLNASAFGYQNAGQMLAPMLSQLPPQLRQMLPPQPINTPPSVFTVYADEKSLRGVSNNDMQTGVTVGLIAGAIAVPNLIKTHGTVSAVAVNPESETAAVSTLRTVNTAELAYSSKFPDRGFAAGLASLGPGSDGNCSLDGRTPDHACLIDGLLAKANCTPGSWCESADYRFAVRGVCLAGKCMSYVVSATPAKGIGKNFCSTDSGVIRSRSGPPLTEPLTVAECRNWMPVR